MNSVKTTPSEVAGKLSAALDGQVAQTNPDATANKVPAKITPFDTFQNLIAKYKKDFALLVPKSMDPEKVFRLALSAVRRTPKLLECEQVTVIGAMLEATACGLEVNTQMKEAYLVPFVNNRRGGRLEAQLIVGYRGYVKLFLNSPKAVTIFGSEVYANDIFDYEYGTKEFLLHKPKKSGDRGEITHFYAYARMQGDSYRFVVMSRDEVDAIRDEFSAGYKAAKAAGKDMDSPWTEHYVDMGIKTCVRKIETWLPKSVEVQRAVNADMSSIDPLDTTFEVMAPEK
jgi:recombination protein RecT